MADFQSDGRRNFLILDCPLLSFCCSLSFVVRDDSGTPADDSAGPELFCLAGLRHRLTLLGEVGSLQDLLNESIKLRETFRLM